MHGDYRVAFAEIVKAIGLNPENFAATASGTARSVGSSCAACRSELLQQITTQRSTRSNEHTPNTFSITRTSSRAPALLDHQPRRSPTTSSRWCADRGAEGQAQQCRRSPLDDPRWLTLTMAHHIRSEQLIGARFSSLASSHLMEGLKSGKLRCMRESRTNPSERERVPASFWQGLKIDVEPDLRLIQFHRGLPNQGDPARSWADLWLGLLCLEAGLRSALATGES